MAFIVEDGSGLTDSNAYVDITFVTNYLTDIGEETEWLALATDTLREQAIVKASRYIDQRFSARFKSDRTRREQSMQWPRDTILDDFGRLWIASNEIPDDLKRGCAEYTNRVSVDGVLLIADPASSRTLIQVKEKIGPIETDERYDEFQGGGTATVSVDAISSYPTADLWIENLLEDQGDFFLRKA